MLDKFEDFFSSSFPQLNRQSKKKAGKIVKICLSDNNGIALIHVWPAIQCHLNVVVVVRCHSSPWSTHEAYYLSIWIKKVSICIRFTEFRGVSIGKYWQIVCRWEIFFSFTLFNQISNVSMLNNLNTRSLYSCQLEHGSIGTGIDLLKLLIDFFFLHFEQLKFEFWIYIFEFHPFPSI